MVGGLSGVQVYRAYAELTAHQTAHWPLPYFLKIGNRNEIFDEYQNYERQGRAYIPFHLGPRLDGERCCLGSQQGILVGDYVDESESLRDCASDGRGAAPIACLFTRTLHGWYRGSNEDPRSLATHLFPLFPKAMPMARFRRAKKLGAKKKLAELRALFEHCKKLRPVRVGPIHGDLHPGNVLVRASDAIIIDFAKHRPGPLVYDAASLEAGLLADGFDRDKRDVSALLESIMPLYTNLYLLPGHTHAHPKNPSFWLYPFVRQIRLYARPMECHEGQYAAALAVALLKKACKDLKFTRRKEDLRAGAYVLAELVLLTTFGEK